MEKSKQRSYNDKKINVYFHGENLDKVKELAKRQNRSTNKIINMAIEAYLNEI